MIAFHCQCGNGIQAPDEYAGKHAKCRKCGQVVAIPANPAAVHTGTNSGARSDSRQYGSRAAVAQERSSGLSSETKIAIGVIGAAVAIIVGFIIWFFAIRDTWEVDHSVQISSLHEQALELKARNDLPGAAAKLHEALVLVGKHNLKDDNLRSVMDDVHSNSQEIDRLLVIRDLPKHLQDAADLLAADKIEESRAAYQAVLDAVSAQGTNAGQGGLHAADRAKDGLARVDARQAAIVAERNQQEADKAAAEQRKAQEAALAKQRQEEDARNAKIRATVSGGAWSVKGGGTSDLLRGMKVYLLKSECSGASVRRFYQQIAESTKDLAAHDRKGAKEFRAEFGADNSYAAGYDSDAKADDEYVTKVLADAKKIPDRMNVRDAYLAMRATQNLSPYSKRYTLFMPLHGGFDDVVAECTQKDVQVNIDGKFSLDAVSGGTYYLYAYWSTKLSAIEWLIPITVKEAGSVSQDLFNDTAEIIWNKRD